MTILNQQILKTLVLCLQNKPSLVQMDLEQISFSLIAPKEMLVHRQLSVL